MERIIEPTLLQHEFSSLFPRLILASSSPNRRKLIQDGGSIVEVFTPEADESIEGLGLVEAMEKNARVKMEAYLSSPSFSPLLPAISADTLVHIDNKLLGKPKDRNDARNTLHLLSGRRQTVLTGCALYLPEIGMKVFCDQADVIFKKLSDEEIESYLDLEEWKGAAGGYRLQKNGWKLVEKIEGDWTTVVGLPLERLIELKKSFNQEARRNAPDPAEESL